MTRETVKIDATGETVGRLATKIAILLRGKNRVEFQPHIDAGAIVEVKNYDKVKFTGKKMEEKIYFHHTKFIGGMKTATPKKKMATDPTFVLRNAVIHMLPDNKMRDRMIKRLKFVD
ncbi:MAG: 50S ribosomal protein L13 [Parcubacteria group bacterium GW2011_GWC2_38_7]|nr:MAG: 50S ribosomal protein L13 [Parcubacteria group bacterium GW2011_GWC2_38_7]